MQNQAARTDVEWEYSGVKLTLHNVIIPEAKLYPSPSALDNLDEESEIALRFLGCEMIQDAGILLRLPQVAIATASVLYQRFYYSKSFVRCNYEHYSMACLFLAAKIEENSRRLRDIINVYHHMRQVKEQKVFTPLVLDNYYMNLKNTVIKAERRILKEMGFCVHGKHPHKLIICYLQALGQHTNTKLVQIAWNYMNDCLRTDAFVRYYPETIACACIFLAARQLGVCLPSKPGWWEMYNVGEMSMQTISHQLLRMYSMPRPDPAALEARIAELLAESRASRPRAATETSSGAAASVPADGSNGHPTTGSQCNGTGSGERGTHQSKGGESHQQHAETSNSKSSRHTHEDDSRLKPRRENSAAGGSRSSKVPEKDQKKSYRSSRPTRSRSRSPVDTSHRRGKRSSPRDSRRHGDTKSHRRNNRINDTPSTSSSSSKSRDDRHRGKHHKRRRSYSPSSSDKS